MSRSEFFRLVLAPTGHVCIMGLMSDSSQPPKQSFHVSVEEAEDTINALSNAGREVYFACATFKDPTGKRSAKNAEGYKSFYMDIDCGPGKPYENQKAGMLALQQFLEDTRLPLPTIINSGRGLHLYWTLDEALTYNEWKPVADALKRSCDTYSFDADPVVTADGARILRVPGTFNNKDRANPKEVKVLKLADTVDLPQFKLLIGLVEAREMSGRDEAIMKAVVDKDIEAKFSKIVKKSLTYEDVIETITDKDGKQVKQKVSRSMGCEQIAMAARDHEGTPEPVWRSVLSIARRCVDWETAIHKISNQHPAYDPEDTLAKAEGTLEAFPHKCSTFQAHEKRAHICLACPLRGKINSPIALGIIITPATATDNLKEQIWHKGLKEHVDVEIPLVYPKPWLRPKNGGVAIKGKLGKSKDDDGEETGDEDLDETLVYPYDLWVQKRINDPERDEMIQIAHILPKDGMDEFTAALSQITKKDKCQEILSSKGVAEIDRRMDLIRRYINDWVRFLQEQDKAEQARMQFGWHDNDTRFVIGGREITNQGTVVYSPPSSSTKDIAPIYRSEGRLDAWKQVINTYNKPGNEARALAVFMSFGSALYKFAGLGSMITHLTNTASGVGKSTAQMAANSVWGHPQEALLNENDTPLSRESRIGVLNHIIMTVDEITNIEPEQASDFVFRISFNRGRNRMQAQVNAERKNNTSWATMVLTSGNNSLYDTIKSFKASSDGERYRILEIEIQKDESLTKEESDYLFNQLLLGNYGIAGEEFMKFVVPNLETVLLRRNEIKTRFDREAGFSQEHRFYSAALSCAFTGAEIAKQLGLHDIDIERVWNWALDQVKETKEVILQESSNNTYEVIGEFINEHHRNIVIVGGNLDPVDGVLAASVPPQLAVGELIGRFEPDTKLLYIASNVLRNWCSARRLPYGPFINGLRDSQVIMRDERCQLGKGTKLPGGSVLAHCFDATLIGLDEQSLQEH